MKKKPLQNSIKYDPDFCFKKSINIQRDDQEVNHEIIPGQQDFLLPVLMFCLSAIPAFSKMNIYFFGKKILFLN